MRRRGPPCRNVCTRDCVAEEPRLQKATAQDAKRAVADPRVRPQRAPSPLRSLPRCGARRDHTGPSWQQWLAEACTAHGAAELHTGAGGRFWCAFVRRAARLRAEFAIDTHAGLPASSAKRRAPPLRLGPRCYCRLNRAGQTGAPLRACVLPQRRHRHRPEHRAGAASAHCQRGRLCRWADGQGAGASGGRPAWFVEREELLAQLRSPLAKVCGRPSTALRRMYAYVCAPPPVLLLAKTFLRTMDLRTLDTPTTVNDPASGNRPDREHPTESRRGGQTSTSLARCQGTRWQVKRGTLPRGHVTSATAPHARGSRERHPEHELAHDLEVPLEGDGCAFSLPRHES